jgi:vacuolar-type H+-ATPase subunit H
VEDILHFIDQLEEELDRGWKLPLTSMVMVNKQRLWDIIDNMRIYIPEEVQKARRLSQERERILAQAEEEAGRIVDLARKRAEEMASSHELAQSARAEAVEIISQARREAQQFQAEADSYALEVMIQLGKQLESVLQTVQNGVQVLSSQRERGVSSDPGQDRQQARPAVASRIPTSHAPDRQPK